MAFDQSMGDLYPFSLRQKLTVITEPSPYYMSGDCQSVGTVRSFRWRC